MITVDTDLEQKTRVSKRHSRALFILRKMPTVCVFLMCLAATVATQDKPPSTPLAQRFAEGWRWRSIHPVDNFRFVTLTGTVNGLQLTSNRGIHHYNNGAWDLELEAWHPLHAAWTDVSFIHLIGSLKTDAGILLVSNQSVTSITNDGERKVLFGEGVDASLNLHGQATQNGLITAVARLDSEHLVVAIQDGLYTASMSEIEILTRSPSGAGPIVGMTRDSDGVFWLSTRSALWRWPGKGSWERLSVSPDVAPVGNMPFVLAQNGRAWFLPHQRQGPQRLLHWDGHNLAELDSGKLLSGLTDAILAPDGTLVATSPTRGLQVWENHRWSMVDPSPPSSGWTAGPEQLAWSQHHLAVLSSDGELRICDTGSRRWSRAEADTVGLMSSIHAISPAREGGLWLGTEEGLARFKDGYVEMTTLSGDDPNGPIGTITSVVEDNQGQVWVGSQQNFRGLRRYEIANDAWHQVFSLEGPEFLSVRDLVVLSDGTLIAAVVRPGQSFGTSIEVGSEPAMGGIAWFDGTNWHRVESVDGLALGECTDLSVSTNGSVWAATASGILHWVAGQWTRMTLPPAIPPPVAIHIDQDQYLWVGYGNSQQGVHRLSMTNKRGRIDASWMEAYATEFAQVSSGKIYFASMFGLHYADKATPGVTFAVADLGSLRSAYTAMESDSQGGLWLGAQASGLFHFTPEDTVPPILLGLDWTYPGSEGDVTISWQATDRWHDTPPENLQFRYRVTTADAFNSSDTWSPPLQGVRSLSLHHLSAGSHMAEVQVFDMAGNTTTAVLKDRIDVPLPWYMHPVVLLLACLAFLSLVSALVFWVRHNRVRLESRALLLEAQEEERRRLSRELHDDLGQLLTATRIRLEQAAGARRVPQRNEAIRHALDATVKSLERVRRISRLLRPRVLDEIGLKEGIHSHLDEVEAGGEFTLERIFDFENSDIPPKAETHLYRVVQEALNNVSKHAQANHVKISLRRNQNALELEIADDGRGFDSTQDSDIMGLGLRGMGERAKLMNASYDISSKLGKGTILQVAIPLEKNLPSETVPDLEQEEIHADNEQEQPS
ncbi:MAG: two-component regulator propeller domain-containing protein [Planctomycetota bacterium]|nr:two-component regulator propeller domain-containing protein [Planctomycetota bacterium]